LCLLRLPRSDVRLMAQMDDRRNSPESLLSAGVQPTRVLIVDDDPTQLLLMSETLRQRGFEVVEARDGAVAAAEHRAFDPDLVLLDIEMPEMDGFAACASIRREADPDLPIIMVTGLDDAESIHRAFAAGATDFITKPINWALFHHRVAAILRTARASALHQPGSGEESAADVALVVARNGLIVEQLGRQLLTLPPGVPSTLADVWPRDVADAMRQRISGVLRTRQSLSHVFVPRCF
jgi:DNA-binding response OmpR family regulator